MSQFILQPGESLLAPVSPFDAAERFGQFINETGMSPADLAISPLVALPLPIYPQDWEGRKRWPGLRPEMMSNPLFWLPARVAGRYMFASDEEGDTLESLDEWAVRVALEVQNAGFYDVETGEWEDVLAEFDLDINDPAVVERVRQWMDGGADEQLDAIDMTDFYDIVVESAKTDDFGFEVEADDFGFEDDADAPDPKHWAVAIAANLIYEDPIRRFGPGQLVILRWASVTDELAAVANDLRGDLSLNADQIGSGLDTIVGIADDSLTEVPDFGAYRKQWDAAMANWDGFEDSLRNSVVALVAKGLGEMRDFYEAQVKMMAQAEEATEV